MTLMGSFRTLLGPSVVGFSVLLRDCTVRSFWGVGKRFLVQWVLGFQPCEFFLFVFVYSFYLSVARYQNRVERIEVNMRLMRSMDKSATG